VLAPTNNPYESLSYPNIGSIYKNSFLNKKPEILRRSYEREESYLKQGLTKVERIKSFAEHVS